MKTITVETSRGTVIIDVDLLPQIIDGFIARFADRVIDVDNIIDTWFDEESPFNSDDESDALVLQRLDASQPKPLYEDLWKPVLSDIEARNGDGDLSNEP